MILAADIVQAAESMIGTPFVHQGRVPGKGLDCVGLLVAVARQLGLKAEDRADYPPETSRAMLTAALAASCARLSGFREARPGDILVFRRGRERWHTGILAALDPPAFVHAWSKPTGGSVRRDHLDRVWRRSIREVWRYREEG